MWKSASQGWCLFVLIVLLGSPAGAREYSVLSPEDVYYGNEANFNQPGVVELEEVFQHIGPYRQILEDGLTQDDAEYWILLEKANRIFDRVMDEVAQSAQLDLIAEVGALSAEADAPPVPDTTDQACQVAARLSADV